MIKMTNKEPILGIPEIQNKGRHQKRMKNIESETAYEWFPVIRLRPLDPLDEAFLCILNMSRIPHHSISLTPHRTSDT